MDWVIFVCFVFFVVNGFLAMADKEMNHERHKRWYVGANPDEPRRGGMSPEI
ncbi:MAG: hypothetical protein JW768_12650 [Chitinispirillaceae bacterium]|nr:hypothetical protein [Chitinispirillaceae bacterium]